MDNAARIQFLSRELDLMELRMAPWSIRFEIELELTQLKEEEEILKIEN